MVGTILTSSRLSSNDISSLANILETTFRYFCANNSPCAENYLKEISTVVGLGFTAVLTDRWLISAYWERFRTFVHYGNFKKNEGCISLLSLHIAEMVDLALHSLRSLNTDLIKYPEDFKRSLKKALGHLSIQLAGKQEEAERLLNLIFG